MSNKTADKYGKQLPRNNREIQWVKLGKMKVSALVQRELKPSRVDYLSSVFNLEMLGNPEVSFRDGHYYIMDGQHRIEAVKNWLGKGWEDQCIQCWVATGLSEKDEAEIFLTLNDTLSIDTFQKFKVALRAGREIEIAIACIVNNEHLVISKDNVPGGIHAVGTLKRVYIRDGAQSLGRALVLIRDAFGDSGLDAIVIDGFGMLCNRYNGVLDEKQSAITLSNAHGGVKGLIGMAEALRLKTGNGQAHCVAAAAVNIINRDRKNKDKLVGWFKE
jgi:hypothetical protein